MDQLVYAKVEQATALLAEFGLDAALLQFTRESGDHRTPIDELCIGTAVTWPSAFLIGAARERIAIVATGDVENVRAVGAWDEVIGYVRDIGEPLRTVLKRLDPGRIGVPFSVDDDQADAISHGMWLMLNDCLAGTPYIARLTSASSLLTAVRGRKLPEEVRRMESVIAETHSLFEEFERCLRSGITEREAQAAMHTAFDVRGLGAAWHHEYDPIVNFGPESLFGHTRPADVPLAPGMTVHVDMGVRRAGYCSDLQRMWYALAPGELSAPRDVSEAFDNLVHSIQAGFGALRPGVAGWHVDSVARGVLTGAGYQEPEFAFGHQLGRSAHDGGALLGPRWPRYGDRPLLPVEEGNVFTLEFGLRTRHGVVALEEDVLVTTEGARYLHEPQTELRLLRL